MLMSVRHWISITCTTLIFSAYDTTVEFRFDRKSKQQTETKIVDGLSLLMK